VKSTAGIRAAANAPGVFGVWGFGVVESWLFVDFDVWSFVFGVWCLRFGV